MAEYDLVIRNTTIATASDVVKGDIGVQGGRVVALGERLDKGRKEIDASGLIAVPGGIDAHVHFDQDTADGSVFCDDFESGSRAAAAGGTTTIIPFAYQNKGQPLRDVVNRYHKRADGKSLIDYAFHVILSDTSEKTMGQDFAALVADGYTSFKVYMTYDKLKLDDIQLLDVLDTASTHGALVMVHAENNDMIKWIAQRLLARGRQRVVHVHRRDQLAQQRRHLHHTTLRQRARRQGRVGIEGAQERCLDHPHLMLDTGRNPDGARGRHHPGRVAGLHTQHTVVAVRHLRPRMRMAREAGFRAQFNR